MSALPSLDGFSISEHTDVDRTSVDEVDLAVWLAAQLGGSKPRGARRLIFVLSFLSGGFSP